jgi:serine/threonine protein kinase
LNKKRNILLTKENKIKLVDLGVAKYTSKSTIGRTYRGTKQYMSPEQNRGKHYEDDEEYETHSYSTDIWY